MVGLVNARVARTIPIRLDYRCEGTPCDEITRLRQHHNLAIYSIRKREWEGQLR